MASLQKCQVKEAHTLVVYTTTHAVPCCRPDFPFHQPIVWICRRFPPNRGSVSKRDFHTSGVASPVICCILSPVTYNIHSKMRHTPEWKQRVDRELVSSMVLHSM
ncbi:hypothetical protein SARC_10795 [Sphaeroforma arctica JP610]|uniref:Uncharacterized protein n=1 Tax=Sphaeroforma arctica JP610 TaxID=667725 RepID=A0A0L0FJS5_9EUKA|nr:hypothetical protein SARC_10795 [Sphaeroforma arctica JP610]KNC76721.1 hypothetical protein SARC_10795 [Sphaeroforma arctica JP610]|eukprot:XP_014150623.1 hypothetical protein SARC_10795 [Sphaeroforma arctica JP610]